MKNHPLRVSVNILLKHTLFVKNKYFLLLQHKIRKQTQSQSGRQHCKTKEPQVRTGALSKWGRRDVLKETFQTFCKETHPNESSVFNLCFFLFMLPLLCKTKIQNISLKQILSSLPNGTHCRILTASKGRKKKITGKSVWATNGWRWLVLKWKAFPRVKL